MQSSLVLGRAAGFSSIASPCRPCAPASRSSLLVTNAYGDLPNIGGGRKWKYPKANKNGKVEAQKLHVKRGDFVQVIAGSDKGVTGTITEVLPKIGLIKIEGVNIKTKHFGPPNQDEQGSIKKIEYPFHHSNVQHFSKEKNVRSRIGHKFLENGKKVRYLIKTGEILD
ncbi:plastid ribosomal protein L24 [Dunaliella salina]|uniref:Plastid ribosomal protein L24 n=1 Tax=Dunaliella salina TaxID=3046 RepID=A0ABQ7H5X2_DUNSA|nr:plastid ribosomal protein L24 [Dunaliella salina]|eukprot:KAF5842262.1 plastid ribosomal protein L24 [Dunaliella salina]